MSHLILNDLDESLVERLQTRAAAHGRTVEEEHRAILEEALATPEAEDDSWKRMAERRARLSDRYFPDTTALIRQMRDERAGIVPEQPE